MVPCLSELGSKSVHNLWIGHQQKPVCVLSFLNYNQSFIS
jgi:hypothetical protein